MKPFGTNLIAYGVTLLATFVVTTAQAAAGKATVRAIRGTAEFIEGGKTGPLKVGKILRGGASVRTAPGGQVDLFLGENGPVVRVQEDSTLALDKLNLDTSGAEAVIETELNLKSGQIQGNVKKLAKASNYEVKTPTSVAGIRGTQYAINANGGVTVISGSVIVAYVNGAGVTTAITVNAGQTFAPPADRNAVPTPATSVTQATQAESQAAVQSIIAATTVADPQTLQATIAEIASVAAAQAAAAVATGTPDQIAAAANTAAAAIVNQAVASAQAAAQAVQGQAGAGAAQAAVNTVVRNTATLQAGSAATAAATVAAAQVISTGGSQAQAQAAAQTAANAAAQSSGAPPTVVAQIANTATQVASAAVAAQPTVAPGNVAQVATQVTSQIGAQGQVAGVGGAPPVAPPTTIVVTPPPPPPIQSTTDVVGTSANTQNTGTQQ